jgi:hydroxyethylthiazole kinase-like uncharacterized protein yjeF
MVKPVPLQKDGILDIAALSIELEKVDVILAGPGCGINEYSKKVISFISGQWNKPAVIDADGLNVLAKYPELISGMSGKPIVLTPHWGEFARLVQKEMQELEKDCLAMLKPFVEKHKLNVLLKSHTSLFYDGIDMLFNNTGNDGLATGGSGDVLSGLIAGFLAQGFSPADAAGTAAYFLGHTAELLADVQDTCSILPTDILDNIFTIEYDDTEDTDY